MRGLPRSGDKSFLDISQDNVFPGVAQVFRERNADQSFVDGAHYVGRAGQGPKQNEVVLVARQERPFASSALHY